jgi:hypothetical protein
MWRRRVGEWRYSSTILDLGTRWRYVVSFTPRPLYPREITPGTHWTEGWVGPRTGLNDVEGRKILPPPGLEFRPLGRPAGIQSLYRLRYPGSFRKTQPNVIFPSHDTRSTKRPVSKNFLTRMQFLFPPPFFYFLWVGWDWVHLVRRPLLAYCTSPGW